MKNPVVHEALQRRLARALGLEEQSSVDAVDAYRSLRRAAERAGATEIAVRCSIRIGLAAKFAAMKSGDVSAELRVARAEARRDPSTSNLASVASALQSAGRLLDAAQAWDVVAETSSAEYSIATFDHAKECAASLRSLVKRASLSELTEVIVFTNEDSSSLDRYENVVRAWGLDVSRSKEWKARFGSPHAVSWLGCGWRILLERPQSIVVSARGARDDIAAAGRLAMKDLKGVLWSPSQKLLFASARRIFYAIARDVAKPPSDADGCVDAACGLLMIDPASPEKREYYRSTALRFLQDALASEPKHAGALEIVRRLEETR